MARGDGIDAIVDFIAGMTDRFALSYAADCDLVARIKDSPSRRSSAAADMVEVVGGRTQLRKAGARYTGPLPVPRGADAELLRQRGRQALLLLRLRRGGDLITFVRETEQLDFAEAVEWLAERFRVKLEYEETSPQQDAARKRRERLFALLDQAAAFYERTLWETEAGSAVRATTPRWRGLSEEVCREFRLGSRPATGSRRRRRRRASPAKSCAQPGSTNQRGNDYFQRRLMFPLADARGRVVGFQARKLHDDDPLRGKYVNSPESELFHKSDSSTGCTCAWSDRKAGPCARRGQHRRARAAPGGVRAGRRVDGDGAHRAAAARQLSG